MSVLSKGLVQGANCFPSDESLSEFNLLVNYSGIHSQQSHLFTIVLPSDHLPSINTCPLGTPTDRVNPLSNLDKLSLRRDWEGESGGGGRPFNTLAFRAKMCLGRPNQAFTQNLGREHVALPEPYCAPGSLMSPQIILMPFVWKLFVEASHFPTSHAKCCSSPKPLGLLHSPSANCAGRWGALNANEGNGWHSWGTPALGTPPLLLRSLGTVAERL